MTPSHSMRQTGFEPMTFGSGGRRSIQLSYWRRQQTEVVEDGGGCGTNLANLHNVLSCRGERI